MQRALWIGTTVDLILFLPAIWIAFTGLAVTGLSSAGTVAYLIAAIVFPVVCIAAPVLAWKLFDRTRAKLALVTIAFPFVYGAAMSVALWVIA